MHAWLLPSITASLIGACCLCLIFGYLWRMYRQPFLATWLAAWAFYCLRLTFELIGLGFTPGPWQLAAHLANTAASLLLLIGSRQIADRPAGMAWPAAALVVSAWTVAASLSGLPAQAMNLPVFIYSGLAMLLAGVLFLRLRHPGFGGWLAGMSLIVWGLHKFDYPLLRYLPAVAPWGFMLGGTLALTTALGSLLYYFVRTRDELARSEERYRLLVDNAADSIYLADEKGRILDTNAEACRILGYTREEILKLTVDDVDADRLPDGEFENISERLPLGRPINIEVDHRRKDGSRLPVEVRILAFREAGELRVLGLARDITERRAAQAELIRTKEAAERANQAKSLFLANMSHELRTPLAGLLGSLELLSEHERDADRKAIFSSARLAGKNLSRLIDDLLDLSRIESGGLSLSPVPFDPAEAATQARAPFLALAAAKGIELSLDLDPNLPPSLVGDPVRLRQILANLVGNAVKFTDVGGVRISAQCLGADESVVRLLFSVEDTGPGMDETVQSLVFEPFVQADLTQAKRHQGAGLGLSIVASLVRLMHGSLCLDTSPGEGSIFHLSLDFAPAGADVASVEETFETPFGNGRAVLVAEDEAVNRMVIERFLMQLGFAPICVPDGLAALRLLSEQAFSAVILDVQMPGLSGLDVCRRLRDGEAGPTNWDIPVVALTAYTMPGDREACLAAGMTDYLPKPVEKQDLARSLARSLTRRN